MHRVCMLLWMSTTAQMGTIPQWTVGDRLRKARVVRGVPPQEMAKILGRSVRSVYGYESDSIPVRVDVINQYALRLAVPACQAPTP